MLHGTRTFVLQDDDGQIASTHSISAGLDYPAIGPEHVALRETGRAEYTTIDDDAAIEAFHLLSRTEGILPALESASSRSAEGGNSAAESLRSWRQGRRIGSRLRGRERHRGRLIRARRDGSRRGRGPVPGSDRPPGSR